MLPFTDIMTPSADSLSPALLVDLPTSLLISSDEPKQGPNEVMLGVILTAGWEGHVLVLVCSAPLRLFYIP